MAGATLDAAPVGAVCSQWKPRFMKAFAIVVLLSGGLALAGCRQAAVAPDAAQEIALPSGKKFRILSSYKMYTDRASTWLLSYKTQLDQNDKNALTREVDEMWPTVQAQADSMKMTEVLITATSIERGPPPKENGSQFTYHKANGAWQKGLF